MIEPAKDAETKEKPALVCRKCKCADLRVYRTMHLVTKKTRRYRRCRNCGTRSHDEERKVIGV